MHPMLFHNKRRFVQQGVQQISGDWDVVLALQHIDLPRIVVKKGGSCLLDTGLGAQM